MMANIFSNFLNGLLHSSRISIEKLRRAHAGATMLIPGSTDFLPVVTRSYPKLGPKIARDHRDDGSHEQLPSLVTRS